MSKRFTLLRRRSDITCSAFREHWAYPHAEIAKGLPGVTRYNQNDVIETLWPIDGPHPFHVDGIVELWFRDAEAMAEAARSPVIGKLIEDERRFLSGFTGLMVERAEPAEFGGAKVIVLAIAEVRPDASDFEVDGLREWQTNKVVSSFRRETLWTEPSLPESVLTLWFSDIARARAALADRNSSMMRKLRSSSPVFQAYLVEELKIVG